MHNRHKILIYLNFFRILIGFMIIRLSKNYRIIFSDIQRWICIENLCGNMMENMGFLLLFRPELNTLICCRIGGLLGRLFGFFFKKQIALFITTASDKIGEGLYIQHGFSTIIAARRIGKNCYINQQVTIGYEGNGIPIIGNNVRICAGAKVIGSVSIGDNAIIGANAVVVKNVPANEVWGGVPAKCIKILGESK